MRRDSGAASRLADEPVGGPGGGVAGVVPALERGDEQRVAKLGRCSQTRPSAIASAYGQPFMVPVYSAAMGLVDR